MKRQIQFETTGTEAKLFRVTEDDFGVLGNVPPNLKVEGLVGAEEIALEYRMKEGGAWYPLKINGIAVSLKADNIFIPIASPMDIRLSKTATVSDSVLVGLFGNGGWY